MKIDKRFKPAIKELIKIYEKGEERPDGIGCHLCVVGEKITYPPCGVCPWVIIEKKTCISTKYRKTPPKERIPRLKRWLKLMED